MKRNKIAAIPYSIWMIVFVLVPMLLILIFAFTDSNSNFTLNNIINVGKYSNVFLRSIFLGAISTIICLIVGYPTAYFISKSKIKNQSILLVLLMIPMWMSFLLRTYAWMTLLENNGIINNFFEFIGVGRKNLINTQGAVVLGMVYNFLPYMILPIYTVLTKIDERIVEAAQDLGANKFKVFSNMIFLLSMPGIISGVTMVFVPAVSTFIISKMLGGGANLLIGDLIEMQFLGSSYNPNLGSAISLVLMCIIMLCMGIMNHLDHEEDNGGMIV